MQVTAIKPHYAGSGSFGQPNHDKYKKQDSPQRELAEGLSLLPEYTAPHLISADTEYAIAQVIERLENLLGRGVTQIAINPDGSLNYVQLAQLISAASTPYIHSGSPADKNPPHLLDLVS